MVRVDAGRMKRILLTGRGPASSRDWILGFDDVEPPAALLVRAFVDRRVANFAVGGRPVVAFVTSDLTTVVTWRRTVGDRVLTFRAEGDLLVDQETESSWDPLTGRAVTGVLRGRALEWAESSGGFWHAWQAHNLDTVMIDPGVG